MIDTKLLTNEEKAALKLTFIGGGNMASAILDGCLSKGFSAQNCSVIELDTSKRTWLNSQYGVNVFSDLEAMNTTENEISQQNIILLAVKPQQMQEVAEKLAEIFNINNANNNSNNAILHTAFSETKRPLIISIAAGVRLASLQQWLGGYQNIIRTMPNMAVLVHAGMTGLTALPAVSIKGRDMAEALMNSVGNILWFKDENQLDAVTAISGSGPAYVFYFIEALQESAELLGLTPEQARLLALTTFSGASRLAAYSTDSAATLREKVTSKGGTTEAALKHLDEMHVKQHFIEAIQACSSGKSGLTSQKNTNNLKYC